jgi:hypothetical protein
LACREIGEVVQRDKHRSAKGTMSAGWRTANRLAPCLAPQQPDKCPRIEVSRMAMWRFCPCCWVYGVTFFVDKDPVAT